MSILRLAALAFLGLLVSAPVQAATVYNCSSTLFCDMGTMSGNTGGTVNTKATSILTGSLAAHTSLTMEYHLTGSPAQYSFLTTETLSAYISNAFGNAQASTDGSSSAVGSLLTATAVVGGTTGTDVKVATITLKNLSNQAATYISSLLHALAALGNRAVVVKYTTAALVPLPASFYMFGLALAGMFYFGSRRKNATDLG